VESVLVCLLASSRAHQLTFSSFKRQVLDELNGDLALALMIDEKYDYGNPFWQHAKYRWTAPIFSDNGEAFDFAQRWLCHQHDLPAPNWRLMLQIKGIWLGGIRSEAPHASATSILPFCRWLLLNGLQRDGILDRYDRFVISRSDFVWLCPHPPLSILSHDAIWLPNGEDFGGLNDRHIVVSRADVVNCLNGLEEILLNPMQLYDEMKHDDYWNDEKFLAHHLARKGLLSKVKRFPYVMYAARPTNDRSPTWSPGHYEPAVGHYVKYPNEFRTARSYATIIHSRSDWEKVNWPQFDFLSASFAPESMLRRLRYASERAYFEARDIVRAQGVSGLGGRGVAYAYRRGVRPWMPGKPVRYAGIPICLDRKWGDALVPKRWLSFDAKDKPGYEAALVAGLRETVRNGDSIVIVGSGFGVTAVVAALSTGPSGRIQCFEGSKHYVSVARQTAARNKITNISIHHAVVGKSIAVWGDDVGAAIKPPSELPACDVLELDCEGAEVDILRDFVIQPRVILVETHGLFGAPTELVASLMEKRGYVVSDRGVAEPRVGDYCMKNDIRVLLGISKSDTGN